MEGETHGGGGGVASELDRYRDRGNEWELYGERYRGKRQLAS